MSELPDSNKLWVMDFTLYNHAPPPGKEDVNGSWQIFRPATAEEIKASHPKCGTCEYMSTEVHEGHPYYYDEENELQPSIGYTYKCELHDRETWPELYCSHHTPKDTP